MKHKKLLIGLSLALLLLVVIGFGVRVYLDNYLHQKIEKTINQKANSPYSIQLRKVHTRLFPAKVTLQGIQLHTDSSKALQQQMPLAEAQIEQVSFEGVSIWRYIFKGEWRADQIQLKNPIIQIRNVTDSIKGISRSADTVASIVIAPLSVGKLVVENLHLIYQYNSVSHLNLNNFDMTLEETKWLQPPLFRFEADRFSFNFDYMQHQTATFSQKIAQFEGDMHAISFDSTDVDVLRFEDAILNVKDYELNHQNGTNFSIGKLVYQDKVVSVSEVMFVQELTERDEMQAANIQVYGFDWQELQRDHFKASKILISEPTITIFKDRNIHNVPPPRKMPHEWKATLSIDSIQMQRGVITYFERGQNKEGIGNIRFDSLEFMALGFHNHPTSKPAELRVSMIFMDTSLIKLDMQLPLNVSSFTGNIKGSCTTIPLKAINPMIAPLTRLEMSKGTLLEARFEATIQEGTANGTFYASYQDLEIAFLKKNSNQKHKFLSSLLNTVLDKNATQKEGKIEYHREKNDSFMRYLWRTVRSGLINTLL